MAPTRLLYIYAPEDEPFRDTLERHLAVLQRQGLIKPWHVGCLAPGAEVQRELAHQLAEAEIVLLLVSANLFASDRDYTWLLAALRRHDDQDLSLLPVIVRPADWQKTPLGRTQVLPTAAKPICTWPNPDEAWLEVVQAIRSRLREHQGVTARGAEPATHGRTTAVMARLSKGGMMAVCLGVAAAGISAAVALRPAVLQRRTPRDEERAVTQRPVLSEPADRSQAKPPGNAALVAPRAPELAIKPSDEGPRPAVAARPQRRCGLVPTDRKDDFGRYRSVRCICPGVHPGRSVDVYFAPLQEDQATFERNYLRMLQDPTKKAELHCQ